MWSILCSISKELFSVEEYVQSILQFDAVLRRFFFLKLEIVVSV